MDIIYIVTRFCAPLFLAGFWLFLSLLDRKKGSTNSGWSIFFYSCLIFFVLFSILGLMLVEKDSLFFCFVVATLSLCPAAIVVWVSDRLTAHAHRISVPSIKDLRHYILYYAGISFIVLVLLVLLLVGLYNMFNVR